jgi:hypothetical protein
MNDNLRIASKICWILCAIALIVAITGSVYVRGEPKDFDKIDFFDFLLAPLVFLLPLMDWRGMYEPMQLAISYLLFMVPAFFAVIAIVLRMIAKAFEEHTIQVMNLMNEEKKKSKEVIQ